MPDEEQVRSGVTPDLIRVSLGLEHIDDIIHDFEQAFVDAGLDPAEGWVPTWKNRLFADASGGTLYTPKPSQLNGTARADATREMTPSA